MPSGVYLNKRKNAVRELTHREVFFAYNGPGPWPCHFCYKEVTRETLEVHHIDGNNGKRGRPTNNAMWNLAASHGGCHSSHNARGSTSWMNDQVLRVAAIAKLSATRRARYPRLSAETRAKIGETVKRKMADRLRSPDGRFAFSESVREGMRKSQENVGG